MSDKLTNVACQQGKATVVKRGGYQLFDSVRFDAIRKRFKKAVRQRKQTVRTGRFETSDIVKEGCLQIWMDLQNSGEANPEVKSAWLRKIAIGHLCKFQRSNQAAKRSVAREERLVPAGLPQNEELAPDKIAETRELALKFLECLAELDHEQRDIILKRFFDEKTFDGIAEELNMTRYRVCEIYQTTLRRLQRLLSQ